MLTIRVMVGAVAGSDSGNGYYKIQVFGQKCYAHRLAWLFTYGRWPADYLDHIDCDPGNNRIANLREASQSENQQNRHTAYRRNNSGLLGVHRQIPGEYFLLNIARVPLNLCDCVFHIGVGGSLRNAP
jgi:HNH endonuclease